MDLENIKLVCFKNRSQWRSWLVSNHQKEKEVWMLLYKKHTNKKSVKYNEAVEEALCFGWIDGVMRRIDDEKHMQRFSPRTPKSVWSKINKNLALKLIKTGKMTPAGIQAIKMAKKNGNWKNAYTSLTRLRIPEELRSVLKKNNTAWQNFHNFANSYQNIYIGWVLNAKTKETKSKRIKAVILRAINNQKSLT